MEGTGFFSDYFERVKEFFKNFDVEKTIQNLGQSQVSSAIVAFSSGFAIGFLFKRYFKTALLCIFVTIAVIAFMYNKHLLTLDFAAIKQFMGFDPEEIKLSAVFVTFWDWVTKNLVLFVPGGLGFVLGYKLG